MQPEIDVLGLPVKTFGLMFALGFLASGAVIHRRMKEQGLPGDWAYEMIFAALAGGLVGARLIWMLENLDRVRGDVLGSIFSGSGLVWYGGVLGGALFVCVWAHWRGWLGLDTLDMAASRWRSATRSGGSAASSPATATTARRGTAHGRWATRTAPSRPIRA